MNGGLCVHLICFANLRLTAGGFLFMGWLPARLPSAPCALKFDILTRGSADRFDLRLVLCALAALLTIIMNFYSIA